MERILVVLAIFCASIGHNVAQEEPHLPEYLVFMKQFLVHVQVREPSGIMFWTRDSPLIEMFGIELHVGRQNNSHHQPIWDRRLDANISLPFDGKFMIIDNDLVISKHEILRYRFSVLHKGTLHHSNYRRVPVTDHLFYRPKSTKCYSQCVEDEREAIREIALLKSAMEKQILDCVGSQATEQLFFRFPNATSYVAFPLRFVKTRMFDIAELKPLMDSVASTFVTPNGVGFRMKTVMDKLKFLELANGKLDVYDFDTIVEPSVESVTADGLFDVNGFIPTAEQGSGEFPAKHDDTDETTEMSIDASI